eukprot:11283036-Karenia_brevis.AAC.1
MEGAAADAQASWDRLKRGETPGLSASFGEQRHRAPGAGLVDAAGMEDREHPDDGQARSAAGVQSDISAV